MGKTQKAFGNASESLRDTAETLSSKAADWAGQAGHYVEETVEKMPVLSIVGLAALAYVSAYLIHSPSSPFAPKPRNRFGW